MKIYYIYFHDPQFVPIHTAEIISELQRRGYEVHVFTSLKNKRLKHLFPGERIVLHNLKSIEVRYISEFLFMIMLFPYLFLHSLIDRPDIFYSRHSGSTLIAAILAKIFRKPIIVEINDIVADKLKFDKASKLKLKWIQFYHYINFNMAKYLFPVTKQIGQWIDHKYRIDPKNIIVVPNGVNINRFNPKPSLEARQRYNISQNSKVILSLGSLFPWSGLETLISAAPKILEVYPDTLFLIGSGEEPYLSNIKEAVKISKLTRNFVFAGFVPWDDAAWFISAADICVAPFIFKDTRSGISSLRVLSYLACGKPVVGSDISGLGDWLEKEGLGFSFPMGDPESLAKTVVNLLKDGKELKDVGKRCTKYISKSCSWKVIGNKLDTVFKMEVDRSI